MRKSNFVLAALSFIVLVLLVLGKSQGVSINANAACADCSDSIKECKKPRDYNSTDPIDGCSCFDCEKGTPKQHLICTKDEVDKKTMFELIEKDKKEMPDRVPEPTPR